MKEVPIWEKVNLTLEEAVAYLNIGINKLWEITKDEHYGFTLYVGNKRLIKKDLLINLSNHQIHIRFRWYCKTGYGIVKSIIFGVFRSKGGQYARKTQR